MSFAVKMQGVADKLLSKFDERPVGDKIQLRRKSDPVWDEDLAENIITPGATIDLVGVATPYDQTLVNGTTIQSGDVKLTVTMANEPDAQDKILLDDYEYSIVDIKPFAYTGTALTIAYAIQIRR